MTVLSGCTVEKIIYTKSIYNNSSSSSQAWQNHSHILRPLKHIRRLIWISP